jgi:predicted transcriptional regulator|nr:MAG TPA: Cro/C1-type HTH DNA-binding domain protein [Caudoviricetes sp.]
MDKKKEKGLSQYKLIKDYHISESQLTRLRHNEIVKTYILDRLCNILDCDIEDICEHVKDSNK